MGFGTLLSIVPVVFSEQFRHVEANSSLDCLDDRLDQPVLATPGGELGQGAQERRLPTEDCANDPMVMTADLYLSF